MEVLVFEADALPGGKVRTLREDGYLLEWGPQSFLWEDDGALARAVEWAGLSGDLLEPRPAAKKRFVLRRGRLRRMPAEVWRILSPFGLLRAACEPFVARRRRSEPESVDAFVRRRFGKEAASLLFDALVSGVFAGDPERLEVHTAFARMQVLERDFGSVVWAGLTGGFTPRPLRGLRGGLGRLPESLAEELGSALRLSAPVEALRPSGEGWELTVGGETHAASRVIVTAPADVTARLLRSADAALADLLEGIPYAGLAAVALAYDASAFPEAPEGFGFLIPRREGLRTLGCLFPSAVFPEAAPPGKVQLRVMIGGRRDPRAVGLSDEELVQQVCDDVEPLLGAARAPERSWVFRHERAIPQYELGHGERVAAIEAACERSPGLHLTGNPYRGVSLGDVATDAEQVALAVAEGCR